MDLIQGFSRMAVQQFTHSKYHISFGLLEQIISTTSVHNLARTLSQRSRAHHMDHLFIYACTFVGPAIAIYTVLETPQFSC
jgi:hypothetical protein